MTNQAAIGQEILASVHQSIQAAIKVAPEIAGQISDGYHTFDELYEHRCWLWLKLCSFIHDCQPHIPVWRTTIHSDGSHWDGWFVLGVYTTPGSQTTYHLPMKMWDNTSFAETLDKAPEFDGHTSADALSRIQQL